MNAYRSTIRTAEAAKEGPITGSRGTVYIEELPGGIAHGFNQLGWRSGGMIHMGVLIVVLLCETGYEKRRSRYRAGQERTTQRAHIGLECLDLLGHDCLSFCVRSLLPSGKDALEMMQIPIGTTSASPTDTCEVN
jgi:hypothetical protein